VREKEIDRQVSLKRGKGKSHEKLEGKARIIMTMGKDELIIHYIIRFLLCFCVLLVSAS